MDGPDVVDIPVRSLAPSGFQVRTRDVRKNLVELVENIRVHGQLEPILVYPAEAAGQFEIIAGQRRWLAVKELGLPTVRAMVVPRPVDESRARALSMSENVVRHDVDTKDLIDACTLLFRKYGSLRAVADELGLPYNKVRNYVKFDRLRPQLKAGVESAVIDVRTALRIEDHLVKYGADDADDVDVDELISAVKEMTAAQQQHYLRARLAGSGASGPAVRRAGPRPDGGPGDVHQIIATIRTADHHALRAFAAEQGVSQDAAAAQIISAFLHSRERRREAASRNRRDGAAELPS